MMWGHWGLQHRDVLRLQNTVKSYFCLLNKLLECVLLLQSMSHSL